MDTPFVCATTLREHTPDSPADVPAEAVEIAPLLRDLPGFCQEATPGDRKRVAALLVERVAPPAFEATTDRVPTYQ